MKPCELCETHVAEGDEYRLFILEDGMKVRRFCCYACLVKWDLLATEGPDQYKLPVPTITEGK